jgi:hypothetical protein
VIRYRDDGSAVEVDYVVTSWGSADGWTEPGDPAEVEIWTVQDKAGAEVVLTDDERERIEQELAAIAYSEGPASLEDDVL